jgi:Phosphotransferase enzyme family
LENLLRLCAPALLERVLPPSNPFRSHVLRGWERFAETVPPCVRDGVFSLLEDPQPLADALRARGTTLVHGDPHLGNVMLGPDRVVMLDWSLATRAPAAVDFVWFLDHSLHLFDAEAEDLIADFRGLEGDRHDEPILELAYLAEVVTGGWDFLDPYEGEPRRAQTGWWIEWAETALERIGR